MKRQDLMKIHQQTIAEIRAEIAKLEKQFTELSMKKSLGQLKNIRQPKNIRHDIARLKSIVRIKELTNQETK